MVLILTDEENKELAAQGLTKDDLRKNQLLPASELAILNKLNAVKKQLREEENKRINVVSFFKNRIFPRHFKERKKICLVQGENEEINEEWLKNKRDEIASGRLESLASEMDKLTKVPEKGNTINKSYVKTMITKLTDDGFPIEVMRSMPKVEKVILMETIENGKVCFYYHDGIKKPEEKPSTTSKEVQNPSKK